jgi:hypothetical protein
MRASALIAGITVASMCLSAGNARAQAPDAERMERARSAVKRGLKAMGEGDPATAVAEYRLAETIVPEANLPYRFEGDALTKLGKWKEAVSAYERYLELKPDVHDATDVRAQIVRLRQEHLEGLVTIECTPPGGQVFLDDAKEPVGTAPLRGARVSAGEHTFHVRLTGYEPAKYPLRVAPGATTAIPCSLIAQSPPSPEPAPSKGGRGPLGTILTASGAVILAGSVIVDLAVLGPALGDFHRSASAGDGQARSLEKKVDTLKVALVASYVTGALLVAGGVTILLWPNRAGSSASASVALHPQGMTLNLPW